MGRSEFEVADDGFVTDERMFPQGGAGEPVVTARGKSVDLGSGELTVTETVAAGTGLAATTTTVTDLVHGQPLAATDVMGNTVTTAYDGRGRPVLETTSGGEVIRTGYWVTGQRRDLTATDPVTGADRQTRFYWDGASLLTDTHTVDAQAEVATERAAGSYLSGVMRHARTTTAGGDQRAGVVAAYYGHDRHGNVTGLTDDTGAVTARYEYDDYGASPRPERAPEASAIALVGDVSHQPFGYAGEYTDPTGTQHLQVRTYDAETRRFHQLDLADEHNPYWFGNANPISYVDPSGRKGELDWLGLAIAGVGLALSVIGFWGALTSATVAMTGVGSFGAIMTATKVTLGITIGAAVADVGLGAALAVDEFSTDLFDDDVALALGVTAGALGLVAGGATALRKLAPVRNWNEALQQNWSPARLTGWKVTHTKHGELVHWEHLADTQLFDEPATVFQQYRKQPVDSAFPAIDAMPPNAKALDVVLHDDGHSDMTKWFFAVLNPRYVVGGEEAAFLTIAGKSATITSDGLRQLVQKHRIQVIRVYLPYNGGPKEPARVWYLNAPGPVRQKVALRSDGESGPDDPNSRYED
ncbi:RHS repeat-associated core domain-containing protein [Agromyces aerolatus]|uniref:RHS repeat-associated core domain-containing protein n=1 Tax=Agromyces sp. LY-1074 TaxID=3074080 RepID=UPI00285507C4|nr:MULTISPECIES: RHS repeat-associated core domain-containing protein [unclassified Agromyces]MDR5701380.1 RHS repeat-associated core domain-containing protein [Agromyces sp. LY-1074]MDR5706831.1 RHS repeat-associated core domain-containing protein [Agromyces sp. LY-1358]